jgi:hypothetical protein
MAVTVLVVGHNWLLISHLIIVHMNNCIHTYITLIRSSTIIVEAQVRPLPLTLLNPHSLLHTRRLLLRCSPLLLHQRATCQSALSSAEVFTLELSSA